MRKAQHKHLQLDRVGNAKTWQKVEREQLPECLNEQPEGERKTTEYDLTKTYTGLPAPDDWHIVERRQDGLMWQRLKGEAIKVIESIKVEEDGRRWLHVSVSKPTKKIPTYDDLQTARILFIGEHRESYMKFPPKERYVNINPVLHLYCCLDQPEGVLPRFEGMVKLGGKEQLSI